ncbi:hypothetical protein HMI54_008317, partial [Coelomomyces lativittatus]
MHHQFTLNEVFKPVDPIPVVTLPPPPPPPPPRPSQVNEAALSRDGRRRRPPSPPQSTPAVDPTEAAVPPPTRPSLKLDVSATSLLPPSSPSLIKNVVEDPPSPLQALHARCFQQYHDGLEKLVFHKLYSITFSPNTTDDAVQDDWVHHKIQLFDWISFEHLEIHHIDLEWATPYLEAAQRELCIMDHYKAPAEKLTCIMNCCKHIFGSIVSGPFLTIQIVFPFFRLLLKKIHTIDQSAFLQCFVDLTSCFGSGFTQFVLIPFLLSECKLHLSDSTYKVYQSTLNAICATLLHDLLAIEHILTYIKNWSLAHNHTRSVFLWLNLIQSIQIQHPGNIHGQMKSLILEKCLVEYLSLASKSSSTTSFHFSHVLLAYTMLCKWFGQDYVQSSFPWIKEIENIIVSKTGSLPLIQVSPIVLHMPSSFDIEDKSSGELSSLPQKSYSCTHDERRIWHFLLSNLWPSNTTTFKNQKLTSFRSNSGIRSMNFSSNLRVILSGERDRT